MQFRDYKFSIQDVRQEPKYLLTECRRTTNPCPLWTFFPLLEFMLTSSTTKYPVDRSHKFNDGAFLQNPRHQTAPLSKAQVKAAERVTEAKLFHFNGFKHYLTLFSKFFPSFARATCLLSVSVEYLALPQIYEVLWIVLSDNPTRSSNNLFRKGPNNEQQYRTILLLWCSFPADLYHSRFP